MASAKPDGDVWLIFSRLSLIHDYFTLGDMQTVNVNTERYVKPTLHIGNQRL